MMSAMTLQLPDVLNDLPDEERELLIGRALRMAVKDRIAQVERDIAEGKAHIARYEEKYGLSFVDYEKKIESLEFVGVDYQEDYLDWYAWIESTRCADQILNKLQAFIAT